MSETTIDDFERLARIGFVTGGVPPLLPKDSVYYRAVLATWTEPECLFQWMDDLEDRAAKLLAEWAAQRGPRQIEAAA